MTRLHFLGAALLLLITLTASIAVAQPRQPLTAGGLEIFYGVIPAEVLLGHPADHTERTMHGGVPAGGGQHHLIVSLFDARTRERISDAQVTAALTAVTEPGFGTQRKTLETMPFAGTVTFGNFFRMASRGTYRIELEIRRGGTAPPAKARFEYSHPRRR